MKLHMHPAVSGEDDGQGGVRRVLEGLLRHLPDLGCEMVDDPAAADVIACHIEIPPEWLKLWPEKVFVHHCHGLYWAEYDWPHWALEANRQVMEAIRVADAVTVPSQWVADVVKKHTCRTPEVISHGLDPEEWGPPSSPPAARYVLWDKTRPDPVCDPRWVDEVAKLLTDVNFVTTFGTPAPNGVVVGKQPYAAAVELTRNAAVYLATSRETFGIATLQALACGVPVVGFAWGAQPEILTHKVDSYLAEPMDVADLAAGVRWALEAPAAVREEAVKTAAAYTWRAAAERYARLYKRVLRKRREERPRTSIIVPAYKLDAYLRDCLDSVQAQTESDWECIVVDDASPDRCGAIADEYAAGDERFKVIHNAENQYLAGARNIGIAAARGRYILPLDADDQIAPDTLALLGDALDADRSIHIAYGNVLFVDEDGKTPTVYPGGLEPGHSGWPLPWSWENQIRNRNLLPTCSMYRREAWEATGGYRRRCKTAEDADFWTRVSSYGFRPRMVTVADTLIYRNRADSMSRVNAPVDWARWFGWRGSPERSPAGAATAGSQLPIPSLQPPAISVVIPVGLGHERLMVDAIDSLEAQTFRWFEAIVVPDTPNDLPALPPWVRVWPNHGHRAGSVAAARNLGFKMARAKLVLPLDADDYLQPEALETWLRCAIARPGVVLFSDFWEDVGPDGKPMPAGTFHRLEWPFNRWDATFLLGHGMVGAATQLVPKSAWEAVGGYEPCGWEDWHFALKLARAGYCSARIARPLWTYRKFTGVRRDAALGEHARNKDAILAEFGAYFDGRETLMACGCAAAQTTTFSQAPLAFPGAPGAGEPVLLEYRGDNVAAVGYRAPSGKTYSWARADRQYVLAADAGYFLGQGNWVDVSDGGFGPAPAHPELVA